MAIQLKTLGQIDLRTDGGSELLGLRAQPKRLALLVYLAAGPVPRMHRRDSLLAMFWPDSDADRGRAALRKALHFIRQEAGDVIDSRGVDDIGLHPGAVSLDAAELDAFAVADRNAEAIALYHGDFLPGFFVRGAAGFEHWVESERARLRKRAADCAWARTNELVSAGDHAGARTCATQAVQWSPDDEAGVRRLISLLGDGGDIAAALAAYQSFATRLSAEFGVEPSAETRALIQELSTRGPTAPRATAPASEPTIVAPIPTLQQVDHATAAAAPSPKSNAVRWWRRAGAVAFGAASIAFSLSLRPHSVEADNDANRVAVFPFVVRGSPELQYLRDGLPILLSARLDGAGSLRTVDPRALFVDLESRGGRTDLRVDAERKSAERFGAQLYILGSAVGRGSSLHLDVALYDRSAGAEPVAHTNADGSEQDLVTLVDRLAAGLLADHLHERRGGIAETAARTTSSLVALKAWLRGESDLAAGRYVPAVKEFTEAVDDDSTFALAHYRLAVAASWAGQMSIVQPAARRAVALESRLTPYTRSLVEAFLALREGRYEKAARLDGAIVAEHPDAIDSWFELAEALYHGNPSRGRSILEAKSAFEHVLALDPNHFASTVHLARIAASTNDRIAVDTLTRNALRGDPDGTHRDELLLLRTLVLGDEAARNRFLAEKHDLLTLDAIWRAAEYSRSLSATLPLVDSLLRVPSSPEQRASLQLIASHVCMGLARFDCASARADSVAAVAPHMAAILRVLIATHPSLPRAARPRYLARARSSVATLREPADGGRIYIALSVPDDFSDYGSVFDALASLSDGDSSSARTIAATRDSHTPTRVGETIVALRLAADHEGRVAALARLAWMDSLFANNHSTPTPILPRALLQLTAADLLVREGRPREALARLNAVPEDLGFDLAYLPDIDRLRAVLGATSHAVARR